MIKVYIEVSEPRIRSLCDMNSEFTGIPTIIDEERMSASQGIEIPIEQIVKFDNEADYIEFNKFIMGITASTINYFRLLKPVQQ